MQAATVCVARAASADQLMTAWCARLNLWQVNSAWLRRALLRQQRFSAANRKQSQLGFERSRAQTETQIELANRQTIVEAKIDINCAGGFCSRGSSLCGFCSEPKNNNQFAIDCAHVCQSSLRGGFVRCSTQAEFIANETNLEFNLILRQLLSSRVSLFAVAANSENKSHSICKLATNLQSLHAKRAQTKSPAKSRQRKEARKQEDAKQFHKQKIKQ